MAALSSSRGHIILSFVNNSFAFCSNDGNYEEHFLEHTCLDSIEESDNVDVSMLVSSTLSHCGEYYSCCIHKDLYLWRTKDWKLISKRQVNRSASAIVFSPNGETIAVADKSGDVFLFSTKIPEEQGELILGHVSMLLDIIISPNGKYIITSDRDEKIRVSSFPNSYNIQSYCLGHEEFVTSLNILEHNENILASGSGDGTLRFWNYVFGKQLLCHYCSQSGVEFSRNKPIISKLASKKQSEKVSILVVSLISFKGILVYNISETSENTLACELKQQLLIESEPWCLSLSDDKLLILKPNTESCLSAYIFCEETNKFIADNAIPIGKILKEHTTAVNNVFKKERHISTLYKRRFDNMQEYLKRKMERIESSAKKLKNITMTEIT